MIFKNIHDDKNQLYYHRVPYFLFISLKSVLYNN
jgi:hypothetical protein